MKIPFVLTYYPARHEVYEILRKNQNLLPVGKEHEAVFKDKIFVTFRRAKSLKMPLGISQDHKKSNEQLRTRRRRPYMIEMAAGSSPLCI